MYFIEREKISHKLTYFDRLLKTFSRSEFQTDIEKLALERLVHMLIEATIDVGNMMIDGFIMRDPGSYEDIIDILIDEEVLPKDDEVAYKELVRLRSHLVREYIAIDHQRLKETLDAHLKKYQRFSDHITVYLKKSQTVANAFTNGAYDE